MNSLRITQSNDEGKFLLTDDKSEYCVQLDATVDETSYQSIIVGFHLRGELMIATGREMDEYARYMAWHDPLLPQHQLVGVGEGFSAFVPEMVRRRGSDLDHKPIVIDPLDYGQAAKLFRETLEQYGDHPVVRSLASRIEEFAERCNVLIGPGVELIQNTLGDALADPRRPMRGVADYVISMYGPARHPDLELGRPCQHTRFREAYIVDGKEEVLERLKMLLRDPSEGILVTE